MASPPTTSRPSAGGWSRIPVDPLLLPSTATSSARDALQHRLSRAPTDAEIAAEAGITLAEVRELRERPTSMGHADDDETRASLLAALRTLPERDQVVIALYFFEGLTLGEIGQVLSVTESRVSQLRSRATAALRGSLAQALHA